jgi:hypothetical protein
MCTYLVYLKRLWNWFRTKDRGLQNRFERDWIARFNDSTNVKCPFRFWRFWRIHTNQAPTESLKFLGILESVAQTGFCSRSKNGSQVKKSTSGQKMDLSCTFRMKKKLDITFWCRGIYNIHVDSMRTISTFCWAKLNHRTRLSTPPPKKWKRLQDSSWCLVRNMNPQNGDEKEWKRFGVSKIRTSFALKTSIPCISLMLEKIGLSIDIKLAVSWIDRPYVRTFWYLDICPAQVQMLIANSCILWWLLKLKQPFYSFIISSSSSMDPQPAAGTGWASIDGPLTMSPESFIIYFDTKVYFVSRCL